MAIMQRAGKALRAGSTILKCITTAPTIKAAMHPAERGRTEGYRVATTRRRA